MRVLTEKRSSPRGQRHRGWLVAAALIATTLLMGCGPSVPPDPLSASSVEARAAKVQYAEAFEICEYGRQPSESEIRELFPFFPEPTADPGSTAE